MADLVASVRRRMFRTPHTLSSLPVATDAGASVSGQAALPAASASSSADPASARNAAGRCWENWSRTVRFVPSFFHTPSTIDDIRTVLAYAAKHSQRVRVVGCGHSPGAIVDARPVCTSSGADSVPVHLLALAVHFNALLSVDTSARTVEVQAGMSLDALNVALDQHGLALSSLGSISDQTVGGALACGTHGSSTGAHALLAASVVQLELLDASGRAWQCSRTEHSDLFDAARVSLGCLGVVTRVTLQCEAAYDLVEQSCAISFERDLLNPATFARMTLDDPHADFVRFHWIPHTDLVVYTRMRKVYGQQAQRDTAVRERAARASRLEGYRQRLRAWRERMVGFHMLQAMYYVSTFGSLDRSLVPRIARLYARLIYPPPTGLFPAASAELGASPSGVATASAMNAAASSLPAAPPLPVPAAGFTRQDRHDRILNFDCLFAQYVTEWAIEQSATIDALRAIREHIRAHDLRVHFPIEIRFSGGAKPRGREASSSAAAVQGDGIWLSPAYATPQTWIGFIMYRPYGQPVPYEEYFRGVELLLNDTPAPLPTGAGQSSPARTHFRGKPHWAKNVAMPLRDIPLAQLYPRFNDFKRVRAQMDPQRMFSNQLVQQLLDDEDATGQKQTRASNLPTVPLTAQL